MTDAICRNCTHLRAGQDGIDRCYSPQLLKHQGGRGTRTLFERDGFDERRGQGDTRKCGRDAANFQRRAG